MRTASSPARALALIASCAATWAGLDRAAAQGSAPATTAPTTTAPPPPTTTPTPPTPAPDAAPSPDATAVAAPRDDAAWQLYHQAFAALAKGDRSEARAVVARLVREFPDHPATARAADGLGVARGFGRRPAHELPSKGARAELALFQTLHGTAVGVEVCLIGGCDEPGAAFGLGLLGGIIGATVSLNTDVTSGQRALVNSGTAWGAFNGAMLVVATDPDSGRVGAATLLGGQAAGVGLALLLSGDAPTAGQVALANSGGQWTLALTGLGLLTADAELTDQELATTLALAADAGLGVGAYLAWRKPRISRAQTLVLDAAGIVGAVAGGAAGVMISGDVDDRSTTGLAAVGVVLGLGSAAYLTRHWDDDDDGPPVTASLRPVPGGGLLSAHLTW